MWIHAIAIAGAAVGCATWGLLQIWLSKKDSSCELRAGCCGGKNCRKEEVS